VTTKLGRFWSMIDMIEEAAVDNMKANVSEDYWSRTVYGPLLQIWRYQLPTFSQNCNVKMQMPMNTDGLQRPDQMLYYKDLSSVFVFGEWKPKREKSVTDHPDFIKLVVEMRLGLRCLLEDQFMQHSTVQKQQVTVWGLLAGAAELAIFRMYADVVQVPKGSIVVKYNLHWQRKFDLSSQIRNAAACLVKIGKQCLQVVGMESNSQGSLIVMSPNKHNIKTSLFKE
jgi:hypothetical protein